MRLEAVVLQPRRYRRRWPLVEAHTLTRDNATDVALACHGRLTAATDGGPMLWLPHSIHPARADHKIIRELHHPEPGQWHPMTGHLFDLAYEPANLCAACRQPT